MEISSQGSKRRAAVSSHQKKLVGMVQVFGEDSLSGFPAMSHWDETSE